MDPTLLIIVAIISVAIGFFASSILAGRREEHTPPILPPDGSLPANPAGPAPQVLSAADKNRREMVILWRELPSGTLSADFDGQTVHSGEEISVEQRRRLIQMVKDLRPWLTPQAAPIAVPPSPTAPADGAPAAPAAPAETAVPVSQPPTIPLGSRPPLPAVIALPPVVIQQKGPISPVPPTIAKQIDDILQERIADTPMANRGLALVELPGHEIAFKVGLQQYDSIDKIPDPEVAAAYRAAIKQWENHAS